MRLFLIFLLFVFSLGFFNEAYSEEVILDPIIINNLEKNSSNQAVYSYAIEIFSKKKVEISETQEDIDFKAKAIKEIFGLDYALFESNFKVLNYLIKTDLYKNPDSIELLNYAAKKYMFDFPCYVLEKNPNISLKDINYYIQEFDIDARVDEKALDLIIENNKLIFIDNIFLDKRITKVSELNEYAAERYSIIQIDDKLLKEFIEYANQSPTKSEMVNKALRQHDMQTYKFIVADINMTKLEKLETEKRQKRKENREYCKKCFLSTNEHLINFYKYDRRSNSAFAIGLLNPINLISTIVNIPFYILLSPLSGLH